MLKPYKSFIFFWKIARHELYIIFPISTFMVPYIACLLYLGANTIWYLHLHLLCDKLCTSFIDSEPPIRYVMWLPDHHHSNTGGSFFFYKYFFAPPVNWGFSHACSAPIKRSLSVLVGKASFITGYRPHIIH